MEKIITPYKNSNEEKKTQVSKMFDNVSDNYDMLNKIITFRMDVKWRKKVFDIINAQKPNTILDIATGTGDMPILYAKSTAQKIVGIDISSGMLDVAKVKVKANGLDKKIELAIGDAENLLFDDNSFDIITVTYGIRNFENLEKGLSEILRVLKPTGTFVILETSVPDNFLIKQGYLLYTTQIMPLIGKLFSKDKDAYSYLATSAVNFPYGEKLKKILEKVGFKSVEVLPQAQGISTIYKASKA